MHGTERNTFDLGPTHCILSFLGLRRRLIFIVFRCRGQKVVFDSDHSRVILLFQVS